jgi:ribose transport system substrate-binding protein
MSAFLSPRLAVALTLAALAGCQPPSAGRVVAVVPKGMTHEFWQSIHRGAEHAAADSTTAGVPARVIFDGPLRERDSLDQIRIIDRRVSAGVDAIVLAPQHSETMVAPVERAVAQGVKVVIIDSGLARTDLTVKYVATDNRRGGRLAAERLLAVLRAEGRTRPKIILFRYAVGSESTEQREAGFEEVIQKAIDDPASDIQPEWLSRDQYAGATKDSAMSAARPLVQKFGGQADGIFAVNESSAAGMLEVLRQVPANDAGKRIRFVGFDASPPLLDAVREGQIDGLVLQNPFRMGYLGTWVALQAVEGRDVNAGPPPWNQHAISTGETMVTRDNVDSPEVRALYDPALQPTQRLDLPAFPMKGEPR